MFTAKIIPFDGDDSPITTKRFSTLEEARQFAMSRTKKDWSTVRVWADDNPNKGNGHWPDVETSHACGKNDIEEHGEWKGTF